MTDEPQGWRPPPIVRPLAIGLVEHNDTMLLMRVDDSAGQLKGWRPLGGGIEFGETAEQAVRREFQEEIGQDLSDLTRIAVMENLYEFNGAPGHEIVFVFRCTFADANANGRAFSHIEDGQVVAALDWVPRARLGPSEPLFPDGLLDHLP